ncbi:MAG: cobalamin-binding protein [Steroidobacteraceae bacterium]|jgi:iron complex transport system substrate-binding protein
MKRIATCMMLAAVLAAAARAAAPEPRIVSLSPHITELLFAAGAGARVVGVDDSSDYPPAALQLPRLGEAATLDIERLLSLKPTLVMLWETGTPPRRRIELERLKVRVISTEQRRLADIGDALLEFGRLAGTESTATQAAQRYRSELAALRVRYAGRPRLSVFYQVWDRPLYTLSGDHVVSEVMSLCGGDNVFAQLSTLAPAVDREAVLTRDPDVILIGATGADGARQTADWGRFAQLKAVQKHHIFMVNPSLIGRMAPRILDGVQEVCTALDQARDDPTVSIKRQSPDDISRR